MGHLARFREAAVGYGDESGDAGRKTIKGPDRDYYLNVLRETRAKSLAEFGKRDDT